MLLLLEILFIRRLSIPTFACANLLSWWQCHENQFLNVGFLTKQILGISRSQIHTVHVFSLVGVLIALCDYCLQVENLNQIIMVFKNQPDDPWLNCTPTTTFKDYMNVECLLVEENCDVIEDANLKKQLEVDNNKINQMVIYFVVFFKTRTYILIFFIIVIDFSCYVQVLYMDYGLHTSLLTNIICCCRSF